MTLALIFGAVETLMMVVLGTQLARFGQPPEVLAVVMPFYLMMAASLTSVFVYLVLRQFAEAMGHPWVPMVIMLLGVGLNAALNWVFIYGNLGMPALGLTGAGISTLVSRALGALVIFVWLRRDPAVRASWPQRWFGNYSTARFREMLKIGLPASGMLLFETTAFGFSGVMIGWLGAAPLAAHQIAITCASCACTPPLPSSPSKWSVPPDALTLSQACTKAWFWKKLPSSMALPIRTRSCCTIRPAPKFRCPTSLLPICPSGSPTACPDAVSSVRDSCAQMRCQLGVFASRMAFASRSSR